MIYLKQNLIYGIEFNHSNLPFGTEADFLIYCFYITFLCSSMYNEKLDNVTHFYFIVKVT